MSFPPNPLPTIGAAIGLRDLAQHLPWLAADARDLEIQDACYPHVLDGEWQPAAEAGRAQLDAAGFSGRLGIHGAYDGLEMLVQDRLIHEVIRTRLRQSLAFAQVLGATHMVIHSPFIAFGHALVNYMPRQQRQALIANVHHILEPILPIAEAQACTIVIECILDKNPAPLIDLVASFDSPLVRLSLDTGHAFIMHQDGGAPPQQWVAEAGELLAHVHVHDVDGLADRHWAVGDGAIDWPAFFRALAGLNHAPRLVLEMADSARDVARSAAWLAAHGLAR
jgi:sugar phosphate isomerase/epimerase